MKQPQEQPSGPARRRALVTGASRGIGRAVCSALLRSGIDVVAVSRSRGEGVEREFAAVSESEGTTLTWLGCDLLERDDVVEHLIPAVRDAGRIDILVHAAGINRRGSVRTFPTEEWDAVMAVNLDAAFLLAREFGDEMAARGHGHIVFLASMLSFQGGLTAPAYAASKGAVAQLAKSFANELAPLGVNVNAIAPGYIRTEMNTHLLEDPERLRQLSERIPAGRWGEPDDIADVCTFLLSPGARYIHGAVIPVDGGWLSR